MHWFTLLFALSAGWPLAVAWRNTRGSTIRHPLAWAWIGWASWLWYGWHGGPIAAYGALTLTAAVGIAVFGARRPGVVAWHFVVIGLLAVLWLPWIEGLINGSQLRIEGFRAIFLAALLVIELLNFLFTRMAVCVGLISYICIWTYIVNFMIYPNPAHYHFHQPAYEELLQWCHEQANWNCAWISVAAWCGWIAMLLPRHGSASNQLWTRFRDRFGAVWALRLREQFNAAAQNAGWPVRLGWFGLTPKTDQVDPAWHESLVALQKRFGAM